MKGHLDQASCEQPQADSAHGAQLAVTALGELRSAEKVNDLQELPALKQVTVTRGRALLRNLLALTRPPSTPGPLARTMDHLPAWLVDAHH
jgi:hypothetical protein